METPTKIEIGAYEAKTKLPELLRQVQAGKRFTITNRGKAVADLIPSQTQEPRDIGAAIDKFLGFMKAHPVRGLIDIRALIEDGRE
jgi:prevent-host-death family protein